MEWLNYHHLRYFWAVAREGSVTRASEKLHISQPTVSAQIRELEEALGEKLFARAGRSLALTEVGRIVFRYADEIFGLGRELLDTVKGRPTGRPARLTVGLANVVPKLIAYRLLEPALRLPEPVLIECLEDRPERLLAELALHALDLVIADAPVGPGVKVRAYSHLLGETAIGVFGSPALLGARKAFPGCLEGAPFLLPGQATTLRRELDHWLDARKLRPRVVGEFDDTALLNVFGQAGRGLFAAPLAIEQEMRRQLGVRRLGVIPEIKERFYAISVERRLKHPAVLAISQAARETLFG
ncbi:MAG: transcriptional activator NhaR [Vicinamibacteria bacterium]